MRGKANLELFKHVQDAFEFADERLDGLLTIGVQGLRVVQIEFVARAADGESFNVQQAANLTDENHVVSLIVAPVAAALDRLQLGKLLLPIPQHVRFDRAQFAHFTDGEVAFSGYRGEFVIFAGVKHLVQPAL